MTSHTLNKKKELTIYALPIIALSLFFLLNGLTYMNRYTNPTYIDTASYMKVAYNIKQLGGVPHFVQNCFGGVYTVATQHPAYALLLSSFAKKDIQFFIDAKMMSFFISIIVLISFFWVTSRLFNVHVAVVSTFLLAGHAVFLDHSTTVACEILLMLFIIWMWYFTLMGAVNEKYFIPAGLMCGLAYLTKATGLFVLGAYLLWGIAVYRKSVHKHKFFWLFFIAFAIVSSPLLVRNLVVYNNPLYNINLERMWLDTLEQMYSVEYMEFGGSAFNPSEYVRTHTTQEIFSRFLNGMKWQITYCYELGSFSAPETIRAAAFTFFALLFVFGCLSSDMRGCFFTLLLCLVFILYSSWFPVMHIRFLFPLLPLWVSYTTFGAWCFLNRYLLKSKAVYGWMAVVLCLVLFTGIKTFTNHNFSDPRNSYFLKGGYYPLMEWLAENAQGKNLMIGPTHSYPPFYYPDEINEKKGYNMPSASSFSELQAYISEKNIDYVVVDYEVYSGRNNILEKYFSYDKEIGLKPKNLPPNWGIAYEDESPIPDYLVVKIERKI